MGIVVCIGYVADGDRTFVKGGVLTFTPRFVSPHPYTSIATAKYSGFLWGMNASVDVCSSTKSPTLLWNNSGHALNH